jgi:O-antigen/teichoic acid export membrane protein
MNIDNFLVGYFLQSKELGLYSIAKQIVNFPAQLIRPFLTRLALPAFSAVKENPSELKKTLRIIYGYVIFFIVPGFAFLAINSKYIMQAFFGHEFENSKDILSFLAMFMLIRFAVGGIQGPLAQGLGKTKLEYQWNLIVTPLHIITVIIGSIFSALFLAQSLFIMQLIFSLVSIKFFLGRLVKIAYWREVYEIYYSIIAKFLTVFIPCYLVDSFFFIANPLINIIVKLIVITMVYSIINIKEVKQMLLSVD